MAARPHSSTPSLPEQEWQTDENPGLAKTVRKHDFRTVIANASKNSLFGIAIVRFVSQ